MQNVNIRQIVSRDIAASSEIWQAPALFKAAFLRPGFYLFQLSTIFLVTTSSSTTSKSYKLFRTLCCCFAHPETYPAKLRLAMEKLGANRPNLGNTPNPPPPPSLNQPLSTSTPYRGIFLPASHINEINEKMAAPTPMMDSGLIGVALIIRSNQGPRWVYHYPPHPTLDGPQRDENLWGTNLFEQPVEDEDDDDQYALKDEDLEGEITERKHKFSKFGVSLTKAFLSGSHVQDSEELEDDEHYDDQWGKQHVPWEQVFEFDVADLQSILTPQKAFHKKKFELCLDPYYFVSYPIHIREDGGWKKKKPKKSKKGKEKEVEDEEADAGPSGKKANNNSENGDEHGGITMFNVVFILDAEKQKIDDKIATIYEHVVKTLNKALHHAQAHGDYVWKESEMILAMKEKAKEESKYHLTISASRN